ncbi:exo-alpha-sialidase [Massilia sp. TS11]|uniref:WD40/YVTN/BNR-like repeat-containing protein n=1 Tax=Massilia sp. TS11 TaxID=2908003 RepID=UPI001EDA2612|nr:exo-alpha-sialidase [Massilia sp. TS11]MCG2585793.1 exo-alpha-sialidase [Massilia sp. TS11]
MPQHQLHVATRKGLFTLERGGAAWQVAATAFLGDPVSAVLADARDGSLYAALNLGHFGVKLHRRDAAGWQEVAAPAYPPQPEGVDDKLAWKNKLIWTLEAGGADQPGVLWAGTIPGGLFRSGDRGASWELVRGLWGRPERQGWFGGGYPEPGIHSICVDPRNSAHLLLAVSCGGVWRSEDGGASWSISARGMRAHYMPPELVDDQNTQDPHRMQRCAGAPDTLWVQHHGGIFISRDNAHSWQEISAPVSSFGFALAVHPQDPGQAWFVPAQADQCRVPVDGALIVNHTRDGGASFATARAGLPQTQCYDLVYRHGLAVADDGRTLAFGSTSGGLWLSDDGGQQWQALDARLPPVYALAFAK